MPTYTVRCRIDAFADYAAQVEADSPEETAELAHDDHGAYVWQAGGVQEFDARVYLALDADGDEIASSEVGDF